MGGLPPPLLRLRLRRLPAAQQQQQQQQQRAPGRSFLVLCMWQRAAATSSSTTSSSSTRSTLVGKNKSNNNKNKNRRSMVTSTSSANPISVAASSSSSSSSTGSGDKNSSWKDSSGSSSSQPRSRGTAVAAALSLSLASGSLGFVLGQQYNSNNNSNSSKTANVNGLPNGLPRTCCENNKKDDDDNDKKDRAERAERRKELGRKLRKIVGNEHVLAIGSGGGGNDSNRNAYSFLKGARIGNATVDGKNNDACWYIVTPTCLQHVVDVVKVAVDANCVVLPQGQNTGLTGGSVPRILGGNSCNTADHDPNHQQQQQQQRPFVLLNMRQLNRLFPLDHGTKLLCLAGVGLAQLQVFLNDYFPNRESHSVLGSTFLNPTTAAGIAFGSGGTQCRKGPAYTERALWLQVTTNKWNETLVTVHNTLGIQGIDHHDHRHTEHDSSSSSSSSSSSATSSSCTQPQSLVATTNASVLLSRLDRWSKWTDAGYIRRMRYSDKKHPYGQAASSDTTYAERLCQVNTDSNNTTKDSHHDHQDDDDTVVSRYNADTRGPNPCRSEGKVIILATVHDTFPKPIHTKTFWISFDSLQTALDFRRQVCLHNAKDLPISLEYMDRDAFDVIDRAGRIVANAIKLVGTSSPLLRHLWNVKLWIEGLPFETAPLWVDQLLYTFNNLVPAILPRRIQAAGYQYHHHVAMTVGDFGQGNMERLLARMAQFEKEYNNNNNDNNNDKNNDETLQRRMYVYECQSAHEANCLTAFRFVAAPAFRTWCVGQGLQGFSVDYALPKTDGQAPPVEPIRIEPNNNNTSSNNNDGILPVKRMRYSHFACNVVHEDVAYPRVAGLDMDRAKHELKHTVEVVCHGKLPAEHGHGTEYVAPPETQQRWKKMDPLNVLNPGIGGLSDQYRYR